MRDSLGLFPCLSLIHFNYLNSLYKKAGAEVYKGSVCGKKTMELLELVVLLNNLDDIEGCGYNRDGSVWMNRNKEVEAMGGLVQYEKKITARVEQVKIKEVSGMKIKEVKIKEVSGVKIKEGSGVKTISEISIDYPQAVSENAIAQIKEKIGGGTKISFKGDKFDTSFEITIGEIGITRSVGPN